MLVGSSSSGSLASGSAVRTSGSPIRSLRQRKATASSPVKIIEPPPSAEKRHAKEKAWLASIFSGGSNKGKSSSKHGSNGLSSTDDVFKPGMPAPVESARHDASVHLSPERRPLTLMSLSRGHARQNTAGSTSSIDTVRTNPSWNDNLRSAFDDPSIHSAKKKHSTLSVKSGLSALRRKATLTSVRSSVMSESAPELHIYSPQRNPSTQSGMSEVSSAADLVSPASSSFVYIPTPDAQTTTFSTFQTVKEISSSREAPSLGRSLQELQSAHSAGMLSCADYRLLRQQLLQKAVQEDQEVERQATGSANMMPQLQTKGILIEPPGGMLGLSRLHTARSADLKINVTFSDHPPDSVKPSDAETAASKPPSMMSARTEKSGRMSLLSRKTSRKAVVGLFHISPRGSVATSETHQSHDEPKKVSSGLSLPRPGPMPLTSSASDDLEVMRSSFAVITPAVSVTSAQPISMSRQASGLSMPPNFLSFSSSTSSSFSESGAAPRPPHPSPASFSVTQPGDEDLDSTGVQEAIRQLCAEKHAILRQYAELEAELLRRLPQVSPRKLAERSRGIRSEVQVGDARRTSIATSTHITPSNGTDELTPVNVQHSKLRPRLPQRGRSDSASASLAPSAFTTASSCRRMSHAAAELDHSSIAGSEGGETLSAEASKVAQELAELRQRTIGIEARYNSRLEYLEAQLRGRQLKERLRR